jgi:hypothetical protein
VAESGFVPPKWRKPAPLGSANAIDSVGTVASPLLAGFSLTTTALIGDDAKNFRWPGAAMLAFVIAAVLLIEAVQCAFNARQCIWSAGDVRTWWPDMLEGSDREQKLRSEQDYSFRKWETWSEWASRTYNLGIVALLAALGLALPPHAADIESSLRWTASGVAFAACAGEIVWVVISQRALRKARGR